MLNKILEKKVEILERENDELRNENSELRSLLQPTFVFPVEWGIPRRQEQVLILLCELRSLLTKDNYRMLAYKYDEDVDLNVLEAYVSKLRKKLSFLGIPVTIHSERFKGYWIDDHGKEYLKQFKATENV